MAKARDRFEHGEHNERVCNELSIHGKCPDWVLTTAFYASLQFVTFKIFPFKYSPKTGVKQQEFGKIEEWQSFKSYRSNRRHELMAELVAEHCTPIHPQYEWLMGMSMTARYQQYQFDPALATKALTYMQAIKNYCKP